MSVSPPAPTARRRLVLGGGLVALLAAVLLVVLVVREPGGGGSAGEPGASAAPTSLAPPVELAPAPVTPEPTGPTSVVDELPPSLEPVALDQQAAVGNGITAEVESLEAIEGTGQGPGNIAGPALRVTVRITNGTGEPVSLDGVAVDLAHGTELAPASPLDDPSVAPFSGMLQPDESELGVYVFSVPAGDRDLISLSVGYQAGAPFLVFTGPGR